MKQEKMTRFIKTEDADRKWHLIDAKGQTLGRLASKVAKVIRGKEKAIFTPNTDTGDFVIVINAAQVKMTGKREEKKEYFHHSGYPGGLKTQSFNELIEKKPDFVIREAVKGMLPKTKLGNKLIKKLKVYKDDAHPHQAQLPTALSL